MPETLCKEIAMKVSESSPKWMEEDASAKSGTGSFPAICQEFVP